ncbi:MAG: hypothetical protein RL264_816 [Bacteroidota bacterium]|jgi:small-conductance mechanosensitive channel
MFSTTLFHFGPFNVCFWNIIFLVIIFFVAAIMRRVVHNILKRYIDSAQIQLEGRQLTWLRLISQSVYLVAIYVAVLSFQFNNKDITFNDFLEFQFLDLRGLKLNFKDLLTIVSVFFGARILVNLVKLLIGQRFKRNAPNDIGTEYVYTQIATYVIYVFSILFCFQALDIDLTFFLTGSAALLVGIGLGLQDVFKDMISGIVLLLEGNIRVGDLVEIGGKGALIGEKSDSVVVKILKISFRTTQIQTREGNVLIIPNTRLTQEAVENWSHGSELTRFSIKVTVDYGSDTQLIQQILKKAAHSHPKVNKEKPIIVNLNNFGDNGLELELFFWADQSWEIVIYKSEIRFEIDRLFREYKVTIPFPKRSVIIEQGK